MINETQSCSFFCFTLNNPHPGPQTTHLASFLHSDRGPQGTFFLLARGGLLKGLVNLLNIFIRTGWSTMPTGAIPTPKNNNPDKNTDNNINCNNPYFNPDPNNPDFNPDSNNPDDSNPDKLCKLRLFLKTKLGTKF